MTRRPAALCVAVLVLAVAWRPALAAECADWAGRTVSAQGQVETRRAGQPQWTPVRFDEIHCPGDAVRLGPRSRAAILLRAGGVLRLDQNTTITFTPAAGRPGTWIDLLVGVVHFLSRTPRGLAVTTPFVNGSVEGTEFVVEVGADEGRVAVWDGRVVAANARGTVVLAAGQAAVARRGQGPALRPLVVSPEDAVAWALYYPPVLDLRPEDVPDRPGETWPAELRRSIAAARAGDLGEAFASLGAVPPTVADPRAVLYRAALLLSVGRLDEAAPLIDRALALEPGDAEALGLRAVVAVTRNARAEAVQLAAEAVARNPASVTAHLAQSYARQAVLDLEGARESAATAARLAPASGLARARLAELWLTQRRVERAREEAERAVALAPELARSHTVLGFVQLARLDVERAAEAFERAIALEPAAPLPRLGRGLARIRRSDLAGGREDLEIAVSLDPGSALLRSYLGKAYYEERRVDPAREQLERAAALDPRDPTPHFYSAILEQSVNRPVAALDALQRSIERNDDRAVYRSGLLLGEDLAARTASLARIYDDLGFQQRALVEGWNSLEADPASDAAHRVLADSYAVLPRHQIARVSEVLQSQLLQPLSQEPVQPRLGLGKSFILARTGPADPSFNEFNPLFERSGFTLWGSGVAGTQETYGDEVVVNLLQDQVSLSAGQFHYETDGFRANNDLQVDVYDVFAQVRVSAATSLLAEYRRTEREAGDLPLRFDPAAFAAAFRQSLRSDLVRVGARHDLTPSSTLLASLSYEHALSILTFDPESALETRQNTYNAELQHLFRSRRLRLVSGAGYLGAEGTDRFGGAHAEPTPLETRLANAYTYAHLSLPASLVLTLGAAVESLSSDLDDSTQVEPKLGAVWQPRPGTTLRAAGFRTLGRLFAGDQTIEPTQVAGFSQLYDDVPLGTDTWRYGIGVDQRITARAFAGAEVARRDMTLPFLELDQETLAARIGRVEWREDVGRAYVYWAPLRWLALSAQYFYERLHRHPDMPGDAQIVGGRTHRVPLGIAVFAPFGLSGTLTGTYVDQRGDFGNAVDGIVAGRDRFWVVDASVSYRLPKRRGFLTLEVRNLLDDRFRFNETDTPQPTIAPERVVLFKLTLAF